MITARRDEPLHAITGRDAAAEGFILPPYDPQYPDGTFGMTEMSMIDNFARLWRKLNDEREGCGWDDNPTVRVFTFKILEVR